ncbi:hypothetical protein BDK63_000053 [Halomonas campaniensis]|uniref:Uncharacterized protein n=1 Tax=Halomonas campaniensis TaxID=213554 RepID=A0A7W5JZJ1_9GAMM|nr:hypothetical protein [Halomonas campaniensis]
MRHLLLLRRDGVAPAVTLKVGGETNAEYWTDGQVRHLA